MEIDEAAIQANADALRRSLHPGCALMAVVKADGYGHGAVPVARSAAELLTSPRATRVHECESDTCTWLFVDRSHARRRRWCDMSSCGNRAKARRHYARTKATTRSSS